MARKKHLDNEFEEQEAVFPVTNADPQTGGKKARKIKYKTDRTGWVVIPLALLLVAFCAFSAILALSDDPSGGIAGTTVDIVKGTIISWGENVNSGSGNTSSSAIAEGGNTGDTADDAVGNKVPDKTTAQGDKGSGAQTTDKSGAAEAVGSAGAGAASDVQTPDKPAGTAEVADSSAQTGNSDAKASNVQTPGKGDATTSNTKISDNSSETSNTQATDKTAAGSPNTRLSTKAAFVIQNIMSFRRGTLLAPNTLSSDKKETAPASGSNDSPAGKSSIGSNVSIKSMVKGSWEDNTYRNLFAGFKLSLTGTWEKRKENDSYVISKEDVVGALVVNPQNGDNILIRFFDMSITVGANDVYEEDFLLGMQRTGEKDKSLNAQFGEIFDVKVGSMQYKGMMESVEGIVTMYYLARRIGDYMNIISIKTDGNFDAVMEMFHGIDD